MMKGVDSPRVRPTRGGGFAAFLGGNLGDSPSTKVRATFQTKNHAPAELNRATNASANQNRIAFFNHLPKH